MQVKGNGLQILLLADRMALCSSLEMAPQFCAPFLRNGKASTACRRLSVVKHLKFLARLCTEPCASVGLSLRCFTICLLHLSFKFECTQDICLSQTSDLHCPAGGGRAGSRARRELGWSGMLQTQTTHAMHHHGTRAYKPGAFCAACVAPPYPPR